MREDKSVAPLAISHEGDAVNVDGASWVWCADGGGPPGEVEPIAHLVEQASEPPSDVAEPDEREIELGLCHEAVGESASEVSKSCTRSRPSRRACSITW